MGKIAIQMIGLIVLCLTPIVTPVEAAESNPNLSSRPSSFYPYQYQYQFHQLKQSSELLNAAVQSSYLDYHVKISAKQFATAVAQLGNCLFPPFHQTQEQDQSQISLAQISLDGSHSTYESGYFPNYPDYPYYPYRPYPYPYPVPYPGTPYPAPYPEPAPYPYPAPYPVAPGAPSPAPAPAPTYPRNCTELAQTVVNTWSPMDGMLYNTGILYPTVYHPYQETRQAYQAFMSGYPVSYFH